MHRHLEESKVFDIMNRHYVVCHNVHKSDLLKMKYSLAFIFAYFPYLVIT